MTCKSSSNDVSGISRKEPPLQQHDSIKSIFATSDLLIDILRPLIDEDFLPALFSLSLVSKNFHQASLSDQLWREICYTRWKGKWGFHLRWKNALKDHFYSLEQEKTKQPSQDEPKPANNFWKSRYFFEEQDATRNLILAEELETLVFDFRFWIGQPTVIDGRIVVKSGLLESASSEVRFSKPTQVCERSEEEDISGAMWSARGCLTGHPCKEPGIEWFLDELSGIVQWGFVPNLWPQGSVQRVDNWGWQIQNPNVVLRSIDPSPSPAIISEVSEWDETKLDEIERECSKNHGKIVTRHHLWKDLLDTLENIPLRNTPSVDGFRVTAEIPRAFIEHYE
eukprot:CAMPEP_0202013300 /NCGR_PEP_ID=MMETSP0905-20130828/25756_1 /ASSEMBLY_ACC=CAM_ASM_000554 /TAXON_ID=420261 /ORGANISM="Thalassiosira antarctica, Strain CCMP982" /LENGTH=337 /DNA_ID=CAMNT_0048572799 /DNA_START=11 /DNA_END=1024 /DNA_ORIENTATION=-